MNFFIIDPCDILIRACRSICNGLLRRLRPQCFGVCNLVITFSMSNIIFEQHGRFPKKQYVDKLSCYYTINVSISLSWFIIPV